MILKIKQDQPLCIPLPPTPRPFPSTFSFSLFHRAPAAFPELQWAGISGYVFTCAPALPRLFSASDPHLSDLFFHSCSGTKGDAPCLTATRMDHERRGMHIARADLALETSIQLASHSYKNINLVCVCVCVPIKLTAFSASLVTISYPCVKHAGRFTQEGLFQVLTHALF